MIDRMRMGRPVKGVGHVDKSMGSLEAKERLKCVLLCLSGELTRDGAAARLGVSVRRLRQLRRDALNAAVASLEHGQPGRPRKVEATPAEAEAEGLKQEAKRLAFELALSAAREEIALLMPGIVIEGAADSDSGGGLGKSRASRSSRRRCAARRGTSSG
ncbi:MAG: hypothetical protein ACI8QC_003589 [Planctomycetota bacterium]|jgi:hypothetical protein